MPLKKILIKMMTSKILKAQLKFNGLQQIEGFELIAKI